MKEKLFDFSLIPQDTLCISLPDKAPAEGAKFLPTPEEISDWKCSKCGGKLAPQIYGRLTLASFLEPEFKVLTDVLICKKCSQEEELLDTMQVGLDVSFRGFDWKKYLRKVLNLPERGKVFLLDEKTEFDPRLVDLERDMLVDIESRCVSTDTVDILEDFEQNNVYLFFHDADTGLEIAETLTPEEAKRMLVVVDPAEIEMLFVGEELKRLGEENILAMLV